MLETMTKAHKLIKTAYILATTSIAFIATVAPAVMRAADTATIPPGSGTAIEPPTLYLRVTAYSSSPDETDSTPFITASGMEVRDGIVATNILPFGTRIQIPALFGSKVFTVEDRMNRRMKDVMDVWMATKNAALRFGANYASVVIVGNPALTRK